MCAIRTRVRLLAASWLLMQMVCLGRPLCAIEIASGAVPDTAGCSTARSAGPICPMRQRDGSTCPMHRGLSGQTACKMTAACNTSDDFLATGSAPAVPRESSSYPVAFTLTRVLSSAKSIPHSRSTPPDSPPPRA